ncbi:MAG: DNA mismatch repair endonuclease MutL [Elusimicrobiaceae bacterium]|nr:DNA mismatch repair endonuclease MutL [Elusimicrobiaceae bacterium]
MNKIHVLDEKTAGQIAAGEVIERPAGVLKELLENAIDAGAEHIHVTIEEGGCKLIRLNDDGCGMTPTDLAASVLRHATSKITRFEDLNELRTFGFRGEALYSVAAVSKMRISSCTEGGEGSCLEVEGGKVLAQRPAPAVRGTTVEIADLFFNVPARLKFLKSPAYERACLLKVVEESALANLNVGYTVVSSGREVYRLPSQKNMHDASVLQRAKEILGQQTGDCLISKSFDQWGLKIFITPPDKLVATRDLQFMFVNRRPVESKTIQQAIYRAYQNVRPKDRHPAFIVYMQMDPSSFDVNIHPQKKDIRFENERDVFHTLVEAVGETIFEAATPVAVSVQTPIEGKKDSSSPLPQVSAVQEQSAPIFPSSAAEFENILPEPRKTPAKNCFSLKETEDPVSYQTSPEITCEIVEKKDNEKEEKLPSWWNGPYHYLGQLQKTYLVFENPDGLILIDQHAAQERVLYEHYLQEFEKHQMPVQELIFPIHVDLTPSNAESLMSWAAWLKTAGFELSRFSPRTVLVHSVPSMLRFKEDDMRRFIESLSEIVADPAKSSDSLKQKMVAMLACKKAIKAHDQISAAEAEGLLENMKKCKDGMHCPHGRPCIASMAIKDIAKLFGR